ncbi:MAG: FAD-dependent oxidoreductase, partial [Pseudomonadota bacterium]
GIHLVTDQGAFEASYLIACAGLQADRIAAFLGLNDDFRIVPFRGQYYRLPDRYDDYTKHLIYPVPDPELPFLGVHMTRMVGGFMTVGPNAMLSFGRETYGGNWPDVTDSATSFSFPGFWRMLAGNIAPAIYELKGAVSKRVYLKRCQEYCPSLKLEDLQPYPPGIRAQAVMRDGKLMDDFLIKRSARSIHVCNAPSPAATAAFPIGRHIAGLYQEATAA